MAITPLQDSGWSEVNRTAHSVAVMRLLDGLLYGEQSLIHDRCIPRLLEAGQLDYRALAGIEIPDAVGGDPVALAGWLRAKNDDPGAARLRTHIDRLALRTARIDALVQEFLRDIGQFVIVGAGLDTRAWNLEGAGQAAFFEVDFPQVLAFKQARLGALPLKCRSRAEIAADATAGDFPERLRASGFDPEQPALWLMEGLLVYLGAEDVDGLQRQIRALSAPGSRVIATFLGANAPETFNRGMRFRCDDAPGLLARYGWRARQLHYAEIARAYKRAYPDNYDVYLAWSDPLGVSQATPAFTP